MNYNIAEITPISNTDFLTNIFLGHLVQIKLFNASFAFWVSPYKHFVNNSLMFSSSNMGLTISCIHLGTLILLFTIFSFLKYLFAYCAKFLGI